MNNTHKVLVIITILLAIICLEIYINTSTDKLLEDTVKKMEELKEVLKEEKYNESKNKSEELNEKWFEYEDKLAFFIEHDEVEKISTKVAVILENTINEEYKAALEDVMETTYLLEHVKDKNKLKLKNIF